MSHRHREHDSDSSDSEDETLLLVNLLTLNIEARRHHRRRSGLPRRVIHRDHFAGENLIHHHYFGPNPVYPPHVFRRRYALHVIVIGYDIFIVLTTSVCTFFRFRMSRPLFLRILQGLQQHDTYFTQRVDATGMPGLGPLQKVCAAMRVLAYGLPSDAVDEYIQIGESTARECLHHFCRAIIAYFSGWYLRTPHEADIARIMHNSEARGFPGMLGSIDCMHWEWRNCPTTWCGQFCGRNGRASIILEAVATYDLWIWHAFFGMPGTNNDVNVLHRSPVFDPMTTGRMPPVNYTINGHAYNFGYYLC